MRSRSDGLEGLERATEGSYDLLVLDVMLPHLSGTELCQRLRAASNDLLILMLSARGAEIDRVLGLELDADDYLTKPFSFRELQARVKALLRRRVQAEARAAAPTHVIRALELEIDVQNRAVTLAGLPCT